MIFLSLRELLIGGTSAIPLSQLAQSICRALVFSLVDLGSHRSLIDSLVDLCISFSSITMSAIGKVSFCERW